MSKTLLDILPADRAHAVTAKYICAELDLKGDYEVRAIVNALRREGYPICSDPHGYWFSKERKDILDTIHQLQHRVLGISGAIDGLYEYLRNEGIKNGDSQN